MSKILHTKTKTIDILRARQRSANLVKPGLAKVVDKLFNFL